jgi:hypothetical protein
MPRHGKRALPPVGGLRWNANPHPAETVASRSWQLGLLGVERTSCGRPTIKDNPLKSGVLGISTQARRHMTVGQKSGKLWGARASERKGAQQDT